ncbi:MAG TPA: alpha/beta hydrolase-fold protein [Pseudonocardiaceae bacterium]
MVEPRVASLAPGPRAEDDRIVFALPDPGRGLAGVRLEQELGLPGDRLGFGYHEEAGCWLLALPRPPVRRMEYRLTLLHRDGGVETINDPASHGYAPGAFGDKSVVEMPEYRAPEWLAHGGRWEVGAELSVATKGGPIDVQVLSPPVPSRLLLVAHDGPEYDRLARLGTFAAAMVDAGRLPPFHLALAGPGSRNQRYSANVGYSAALATRVIPALHAALRTAAPAVLIGASLGGLAALHVQRRHPRAVGALFLQSGSFFVPEHDECESSFEFYARVTRFVATVHHAARAPSPVPVVLTCGATEENVHNNRLMAATLARQGYPAELHELPDVHNFTAWRDAFDPYLVDLLEKVWGRADA